MTVPSLYMVFAGMMLGGASLLVAAERKKPPTLDVPIVSDRAKAAIGGSLLVLGLVLSGILYFHK
ncbi:hypothetical protein [Rhodoplanes azumiensis]|uniref:Uncharacterized protein n=1 Tax=Rhodoplanes azumiensis TaxID=1897628 RepID=A0ABW5AE25_9BRAD